MPRTLLPLLLLVSLCSSVVSLAGAMLLFAPASRAAPEVQASAPLVRAERFELVDSNGTVRAALATDLPGPATTLRLFDAQGATRAAVAVAGEGPDSATAFTMNDTAGTRRVAITALNNGGQVVISPGVAPDAAELRRSLGRPETMPGDEVSSVAMTALGPPFPAAGFTLSTPLRAPQPDGQRGDVRVDGATGGVRIGLGLGPDNAYSVWGRDEAGQVIWRAP